ncbi:hypothetical protein WJR50_00470 [Catalinimonas sp. 4WD22]
MSGKNYLLDTNIIVAFFNGETAIVEKIMALSSVQLPYVVLGELYY